MTTYDPNDLHKEKTVLFLIATCGQTELPNNCKDVYAALSSGDLSELDLSETKIGVFGMGDSHYVYFNEAAKLYLGTTWQSNDSGHVWHGRRPRLGEIRDCVGGVWSRVCSPNYRCPPRTRQNCTIIAAQLRVLWWCQTGECGALD